MLALARGRLATGRSHKSVGLSAHGPVLGSRVVIPPEQVQEPVREQHRDLGKDVAPRRRRLPSCGGHAHDYISEKRAGSRYEVPLPERECEDVRRAIFAAMNLV